MHLGKTNPKYEYKMKDGNVFNNLKVTNSEKDLGVYVDHNLNFSDHIENTVKKARNICYMLVRSISDKCPEIMIPLFKSLVRPVLEYGNAVWCPYKVKDVDFIEDVQRYFTKRIIGLSDVPYEERLKSLKLHSLCYPRLRGDMIEVYKITHNFYDSQITSSLFQFADSITRTNGFKIIKVQTNTSAFQHFFTNRVVNCWNSLPRHVVSVDTVNAFKNSLDRHFSAFIYNKRVDCKVVTDVKA
jgi:hypothetical protein